MKEFLTEDFLLETGTAQRLYHEHAARMPIFDYHCHLPCDQIADDVQFENLTAIWLREDHYKWRALRANGVEERFITGDANDWEKFQKWAETVPNTLRNPLYHWTHLELKRYFGINELLNAETAETIYKKCNEQLKIKDFSTRNMMRKMNVKAVCTTDDPTDSLEHHIKIAKDDFEIKVLPTWRPDKGMATEDVVTLNKWIDKLSQLADVEVIDFESYLEALKKRHDFFHEVGCRISDHSIETAYAEDYTYYEVKNLFGSIRSGKELAIDQQLKLKSAMMIEFAMMDAQKGWTQQLHLGALRNSNTRLMKILGPDAGCDSILDTEMAIPLAKFLDRLDRVSILPKTILYNLNPKNNELIATMAGNFQNSSIPGKIQYGSAWWFLDQKDGIEKQIEALSNLGLLSRFIGMTTDSRSFLSYPRHEYFRRILCNILGNDVEKGLLPNDLTLLGSIVENICFYNAKTYFDIEVS